MEMWVHLLDFIGRRLELGGPSSPKQEEAISHLDLYQIIIRWRLNRLADWIVL
jgi:hypothetical protein